MPFIQFWVGAFTTYRFGHLFSSVSQVLLPVGMDSDMLLRTVNALCSLEEAVLEPDRYIVHPTMKLATPCDDKRRS